MTSTLTVSSGALATLLRDVRRAASKDDMLPMIAGVMLHTSTDGDDKPVLAATATDRFTMLHGHIPAPDQLPTRVWLSNDQVTQVLGVMRSYITRKRATSSETEIILDGDRVTFRQVALDGLADISVSFTHDVGDFPKVEKILRDALAADASPDMWHCDGAKLAMFAQIASARREYLRIRSGGKAKPVVVQMGTDLLGLLMPVRADSERIPSLDVPVYGLPVLQPVEAAA